MTKVKVENKNRKQTVRVKTATTTSGKGANSKSLLSRIDKLEKQVSKLNELLVKLSTKSVEVDFNIFKLGQKIDDNRKIYLKFAWDLCIVSAIFVIIFCIVLN